MKKIISVIICILAILFFSWEKRQSAEMREKEMEKREVSLRSLMTDPDRQIFYSVKDKYTNITAGTFIDGVFVCQNGQLTFFNTDLTDTAYNIYKDGREANNSLILANVAKMREDEILFKAEQISKLRYVWSRPKEEHIDSPAPERQTLSLEIDSKHAVLSFDDWRFDHSDSFKRQRISLKLDQDKLTTNIAGETFSGVGSSQYSLLQKNSRSIVFEL